MIIFDLTMKKGENESREEKKRVKKSETKETTKIKESVSKEIGMKKAMQRNEGEMVKKRNEGEVVKKRSDGEVAIMKEMKEMMRIEIEALKLEMNAQNALLKQENTVTSAKNRKFGK